MDTSHQGVAHPNEAGIGYNIRERLTAVPEQTLREIAALGLERDVTMAGLAQEMRGKLPFGWDAKKDRIAGAAMYLHALESLSLYDPDFRPAPNSHAAEEIRSAA